MATSKPKVVTTGTREEMLANATKLAEGIKTGLADKSTKLTNAQRDSFSKQLGGASTNLAKQRNPTTITSTTLTPAPKMPITQPPAALEATGMNAEMTYGAQTATDTYNQNLQNQQAIALASKNQASDAYKQFLGTMQGETGLTSDLYSQKGGVDDVQKELNDINNQILAEQNALINKTQKLEKNAQGMLEGALQDQLQDVERESLRKQADLSIIQMGVQGRYDSAKAIADRAVSAYLEKQSITNDILKFNYLESKDLFTTAEQRAFESAQADRERKLAQDREDMTAIRNLAIDAQRAGASTATVQAMLGSKTLEEAMGKTGGVFAPKPTVPKRDTQVVDGKLIDMQTGEVISTIGGTTPAQDLQKMGTVNDIDKILQYGEDKLGEFLGKRNIIQRNIPGTVENQFSIQHDNLINQLALAARGELKGQGQVSDYEGKLLKSAQTTLNLYMEPKEYTKEAKQVRGAIQTSSGIPAYVKVTAPDGKQTRYAVLDSNSIQEAVNQGYVIEYQ